MGSKVVIVALIAWNVSIGLRSAKGEGVPLRSFDRFEVDPVNASGLWVEAGAATARDDAGTAAGQASGDFTTAALRLAYGDSIGEIGLFLPYRFVSVETTSFGFTEKLDEDGIGDMRLYGRWTPLHTGRLDAGLGLQLALPTGDENKALGTGKVGFLPFGTFGLHIGPADVRAHFGYLAYANSEESFGHSVPPDAFFYGGGVWVPFAGRIAARAEFIGQSFDDRDSTDVLIFEPGIDLMWPLEKFDLLVRPTGGVGITSDSPDWSFGGSFALAWH